MNKPIPTVLLKTIWQVLVRLRLILVFLCLTSSQVVAADFQINFLDQPSTLRETCLLLQSVGVPEEAIVTFKKLVVWQNQGGHGVATTKFPKTTNGFYTFHGINDFTNRILSIFANANGKPTFMCFDAACILLHATGGRAESLDSNFAAKDIINVTPDRKLLDVSMEELVAAPNILTSPAGYQALTGRPRAYSETKLALSLHAGRRLEPGATNTELGMRSAFNRFIADLRQDGFSFPTNFNLGMVFYVNTQRGFIKTDHAFLCFPKGRTFRIVEKDNSTGPYVRADFQSEADLAQYVSLGERGDANNPSDVDFGASVLVSLNERLIGISLPTANGETRSSQTPH